MAYGEIPVDLFKTPKFEEKYYLGEAAKIAKKLIDEIDKESQITKDTEIRVCTGYVNLEIPSTLGAAGLRNTVLRKIEEPLQTWLERTHRDYISQITRIDLYYDPKDLPKTR